MHVPVLSLCETRRVSLNANRVRIYGKISQITLSVFDLRLRRGVSPNFQPRRVSLRLACTYIAFSLFLAYNDNIINQLIKTYYTFEIYTYYIKQTYIKYQTHLRFIVEHKLVKRCKFLYPPF